MATNNHHNTVFFHRFLTLTFACLLILSAPIYTAAQSQNTRERIAVLNIDTKGIASVDAVQMGNVVRTELDKLGRYEVIDRYDIEYLLKSTPLSIENCFGKQCLVDVGKAIKSDQMLSGSIELYGEQIVIKLKLINVGANSVDKTQVLEFLNLRGQIPTMVSLTLKKMFDQPIDNELLTKMSKPFDYNNAVNNPDVDRLNLSGPRMGFTMFTGNAASVLKTKESLGGFNAYPVMFQFGYQFEVQYLNQGAFQALFEFIPIVTGLDQGKFFPSISLLNGLRSNVSGWELAFGPILYMSPKGKGFIDNAGIWQFGEPPTGSKAEIETRFDSRGELSFESSFVFAVGKSFKSGKLNIPINAFFIPRKDGHRVGISLGFNAKK